MNIEAMSHVADYPTQSPCSGLCDVNLVIKPVSVRCVSGDSRNNYKRKTKQQSSVLEKLVVTPVMNLNGNKRPPLDLS
jgi:hypothetical protein